MAELMDLSNELLELIFFSIEAVEDMTSLASSSCRLTRLLSGPRVYRDLLDKIKRVYT